MAFQKFLTQQNNLMAVPVMANQNAVQAEAAQSQIAKASGESQRYQDNYESIKVQL